MSNEKKGWRLKKIEIEFKRGFAFEKTVDRYEGKMVFENNEGESFSFNVPPNMAQPYIDLMANDIARAASDLGERLKESLGLKV